MFKVIRLSDGLTKSGFSSKDDAESFIYQYLCNRCKFDLEHRGYPLDEYGEFVNIYSVMDTDCGAEWEIEHYE